jgi:hypothetical protein
MNTAEACLARLNDEIREASRRLFEAACLRASRRGESELFKRFLARHRASKRAGKEVVEVTPGERSGNRQQWIGSR